MTTSTSVRLSGARGSLRARRIAIGIAAAGGWAVMGLGAGVEAAIVPTVPLATAANYSVLGAAEVTNTGPSVMAESVGVWAGTSITGIGTAPDGIVLAPGTVESATPAAQTAQADLTAAYLNAAGRPIDATTTADLGNLLLAPGVYAGPGPGKAALSITGPLVLDAQGDSNAVFIFQTDSTLITATGSSVSLINGALECNVFWQVGSSATLGSGSVFVGNILADASITVNTGVTVHGRALALNGAVTLDNDVFTSPNCVPAAAATTTTAEVAVATSAPGGTTASTSTPLGATTTPPLETTTAPLEATTTPVAPTFIVTDITLPRTGRAVGSTSAFAGVAVLVGGIAVVLARRKGETSPR